MCAGDCVSRPMGMLGVKGLHVACEPGQGAHVCGLALFRSSRGSRGGAACKGSIPHLEKPKVRILDYPMMGESVGASLRQMGDA